MSSAIGASGVNHDFYFYDSIDAVWNGSTFVTWNDGDYASYRVAAAESGTSGLYPVPTPPAGAAYYIMRERGASLALSYKVYTENLLLAANAAIAASQTAAATIRSAVGLESANLASLVNAVVGKQNVTDNGNGTYDIAIRNAADDATLVTIRYNPTTGVKTVL